MKTTLNIERVCVYADPRFDAEFTTQPVSQFVEKEGRKKRIGRKIEGVYRTWERNCYLLRFLAGGNCAVVAVERIRD